MPSNHALRFLEKSRFTKFFNETKYNKAFLISNVDIPKDLNAILKRNNVSFLCLRNVNGDMIAQEIQSFLDQ